jgi:hypothetical protein
MQDGPLEESVIDLPLTFSLSPSFLHGHAQVELPFFGSFGPREDDEVVGPLRNFAKAAARSSPRRPRCWKAAALAPPRRTSRRASASTDRNTSLGARVPRLAIVNVRQRWRSAASGESATRSGSSESWHNIGAALRLQRRLADVPCLTLALDPCKPFSNISALLVSVRGLQHRSQRDDGFTMRRPSGCRASDSTFRKGTLSEYPNPGHIVASAPSGSPSSSRRFPEEILRAPAAVAFQSTRITAHPERTSSS